MKIPKSSTTTFEEYVLFLALPWLALVLDFRFVNVCFAVAALLLVLGSWVCPRPGRIILAVFVVSIVAFHLWAPSGSGLFRSMFWLVFGFTALVQIPIRQCLLCTVPALTESDYCFRHKANARLHGDPLDAIKSSQKQ